jgi:hypothetical protein
MLSLSSACLFNQFPICPFVSAVRVRARRESIANVAESVLFPASRMLVHACFFDLASDRKILAYARHFQHLLLNVLTQSSRYVVKWANKEEEG